MNDPDARLRELLDVREIEAVLYRYGTSLDTHDWKRLASCFTPDALVDYGDILGRRRGPEEVAQACREVLERLDASQHLIATPEICIEGDRAHARSYVQAQHVRRGLPEGECLAIGGTYLDELVRTPEGWRIRSREFRMSWRDGNPEVFPRPLGSEP